MRNSRSTSTMQWVPDQPEIQETHLNNHASTRNYSTGPGTLLSPTQA